MSGSPDPNIISTSLFDTLIDRYQPEDASFVCRLDRDITIEFRRVHDYSKWSIMKRLAREWADRALKKPKTFPLDWQEVLPDDAETAVIISLMHQSIIKMTQEMPDGSKVDYVPSQKDFCTVAKKSFMIFETLREDFQRNQLKAAYEGDQEAIEEAKNESGEKAAIDSDLPSPEIYTEDILDD